MSAVLYFLFSDDLCCLGGKVVAISSKLGPWSLFFLLLGLKSFGKVLTHQLQHNPLRAITTLTTTVMMSTNPNTIGTTMTAELDFYYPPPALNSMSGTSVGFSSYNFATSSTVFFTGFTSSSALVSTTSVSHSILYQPVEEKSGGHKEHILSFDASSFENSYCVPCGQTL